MEKVMFVVVFHGFGVSAIKRIFVSWCYCLCCTYPRIHGAVLLNHLFQGLAIQDNRTPKACLYSPWI